MKLQILKTSITIFLLAILFYFTNKIILENTAFSSNFELYQFSLEFIYLIFSLFSITILITLLIVNQKNKDVVGMTFLLITSFKIGICYSIFSKAINSANENEIERINFFVVFILFLTIETLITIRLLNKKQ
jgi:hypothetical protein